MLNTRARKKEYKQMATPAQTAANRRNAQSSTGPSTAEGKAAVRLNSLTHGLRAQDALLPGEDEKAFQQISQAFYQQHSPEGASELFCVEKMIISFWRNRRIAKIETDIFMNFYPSQPETYGDMNGVLGRSFTIDSLGQDNFCRLARYESSLDRAFYRASKELQTLQKTRIGFARQNENQHPNQPKPAVSSAQAAQSPTITTETAAAPPKRYRLEPNGKLFQLPSALPPTAHAATIIK